MNSLWRQLLVAGVSLFLIAGLWGCGVSNAPKTVAVKPASIEGLWQFSSYSSGSVPASLPAPQVTFSGALHNDNGIVTGAGHVTYISVPAQTSCLQPAAVTVTGSMDDTGHLNLTSSSANGTVFTFAVDIPSILSLAVMGTGSTTGTCGNLSSSATAIHSDPLNGTFAGYLQSLQAGTTYTPVGTASMTVSETAPDATGTSQIAGTATLAFTGCSINFPISVMRNGPDNVIQVYPANPPVVALDGSIENTAHLTAWFIGSDCKVQQGVAPPFESAWLATLTKQ